MSPYFADRAEAGAMLGSALNKFSGRHDTIILALPRGGVPIGVELAKSLHLPMDLMLVRKLGVPGDEEIAMGAIAIGGVQVLNEGVIGAFHISQEAIDRTITKERIELTRRNNIYRQGRGAPHLFGKVVILTDDGCATGSNMQAAIRAVRKQKPKKVIIAVPVASDSAYTLLENEADEVVCLFIPKQFFSLSQAYIYFSQLKDQEVVALIKQVAFGRHHLPDNRNSP